MNPYFQRVIKQKLWKTMKMVLNMIDDEAQAIRKSLFEFAKTLTTAKLRFISQQQE